MALSPTTSAMAIEVGLPPAHQDGVNAPDLKLFVFALFFIFGGITSLNDVIIPKLKDLFTLSYFEAMLIQSAFFAAYFFMSLPGAAVVKKFGYMRSATIGLLTMMAGCLLFVPASKSGLFIVFLLALFVLASGVTIVQVVANPLISLLGPSHTASSRLTLAQAFNSLGTTLFPYVGSILILGSLATVDPATLDDAALTAYRAAETQTVVAAYLGLALVLLIVAGVVWMRRKRLQEAPPEPTSIIKAFDLLRRWRFGIGALCIFLYVGAEVAIGSLIVNYLMQSDVFGITQAEAGKHIPFYWGGALVGRLIGSVILRMVSPGLVLGGVALVVIALLGISANTQGWVAGWSLLSIGLFNAIMFPTIFTLACTGLGRRAADGSGLICVAIVGGAIIPPLTGSIADVTSLQAALLLPALCYAVIAGYGFATRRGEASG